ncbi:hypothetical protein Lalb_Chr04g0250251 [Lupinus albus]|uniref:Uncharacterized protein n=1 Tax=Lupinus albus TaxID=3870 RepID=A0A6A4QPV0_LUPAL|nr:hypothetical protein Lalb_Chr04g0250251 [Lupinus albus]
MLNCSLFYSTTYLCFSSILSIIVFVGLNMGLERARNSYIKQYQCSSDQSNQIKLFAGFHCPSLSIFFSMLYSFHIFGVHTVDYYP